MCALHFLCITKDIDLHKTQDIHVEYKSHACIKINLHEYNKLDIDKK